MYALYNGHEFPILYVSKWHKHRRTGCNRNRCTSSRGIRGKGRTLEPQKPRKAEEHQRLHTEPVEDEWYITTDHPMTKTEHIAFAALLSGGSLRVWRQYPEWDFQLRLSRREHGLLVWYSTRDGLLYQLI